MSALVEYQSQRWHIEGHPLDRDSVTCLSVDRDHRTFAQLEDRPKRRRIHWSPRDTRSDTFPLRRATKLHLGIPVVSIVLFGSIRGSSRDQRWSTGMCTEPQHLRYEGLYWWSDEDMYLACTTWSHLQDDSSARNPRSSPVDWHYDGSMSGTLRAFVLGHLMIVAWLWPWLDNRMSVQGREKDSTHLWKLDTISTILIDCEDLVGLFPSYRAYWTHPLTVVMLRAQQ